MGDEQEMYPGSSKGYSRQLDLFSLPQTDVTVIESNFVPFYPLNSVRESASPIQFFVKSDSVHFLDLSESYLYIRSQVHAHDGEKIATTDLVAPGNGYFNSLFENVKLSLNGVVVFDSSSLYPYIGWIRNQLSYGQSTKENQLGMELFFKEANLDNLDKATNFGFKARLEMASGSKIFEVIGKLRIPMFEQKRFLPDGVDVGLMLTRSQPNFVLSCATDGTSGGGSPFKIQIVDAQLHVKRLVINPQLVQKLNQKSSSTQRFQYPFSLPTIKYFTLPSASLGSSGEIVFSGQLPQLIIVGLVDHSAFTGKLSKSPYNFLPYNLTSIKLSVNNESVSCQSLTLDFANDEYLKAYRNIILAAESRVVGNNISRTEFKTGNVLYLFDLSSNSGQGLAARRVGQVKVELKLSEALSSPLQVIVYGQTQSLLQVDSNRNVIVENYV
jgi:hypothetical protein